MKILQTADWHIGNFRSPVKDGINLRSEDTKRCLDELVRVAGEQKPDYALVSGDVFDVGKLWSDRCCEEIITAVHYIKALASSSGQVIVMRGTPNHDGGGQFNVLSERFDDVPNVHIVTSPQVLSFEDVDIAVLPGFDRGFYRARCPGKSKEEENGIFTQELSNIVLGLRAQCSPEKRSILMAHYTVPGCNAESGQVMMLTQFEPVLTQEALLAAGFDLVALGHIHRPQRVTANNWFYSGAVNAMNFNDEGQERGFWIHSPLPFGGWESEFYKTPIREFITFEFNDADVTAVNLGHIDEVAMNYWRWNGAVRDKIVRIHYSCAADEAKAYKMNESLLEKTLLDDGAFMLWENTPVKVDAFANRTELASTIDPESNLRKYLDEKQQPEEKIQELILKARPIISEAETNLPALANCGIFEPVEISVNNYRNYTEETFNFGDISFCTINGQNGAGKSSLFMDAIIDCLYEEPREGEKTGWIRNNEKARSGSIMFTFRIGEALYRVTRTRTRSGKPTLNLAAFVEGEWTDRSREKVPDTQQEIINIIGMDSMTFKSCALIMQDQYGLFLQAKPEDRAEVLGNLLGLGVYQIMESIAQDRAKAYSTKAKELRQKIEIHRNTIEGFGRPEDELKVCMMELSVHESELKARTAERDKGKLLLENQQGAMERRNKLLATVTALQGKRAAAEQSRSSQQAIIDSSETILSARAEIETKIAERSSLLERERKLAEESAVYSSRKHEAEELAGQAASEQKSIDSLKEKVKQKEDELSRAQPADQDAVVKANAAEYERQKKLLDEAYEKERIYREAEQKLVQAGYSRQQIQTQYESDIKQMQLREDGLKKKAELLSSVECVDISNARCGFLADAISAKEELGEYPGCYAERKKVYEEQDLPVKQQIAQLEKQIADMGFDKGMVAAVSEKVAELKPYVAQLEAINQREGRIALLKADLEHLRSNIVEAEKRLAMVKSKGTEAEKKRDQYAKAFEEHGQILRAVVELDPWLEKERQLPVAEERKATATGRLLELTAELENLDAEIAEKQAEADRESQAMSGIEQLTAAVVKLNADIDSLNGLVKEKQMEAGALQQKTEQAESLRKEIEALQEKRTEYAKLASDYDTLKTAFSQSGIPHQIIRSIIPQLTATSNSILGQMTGGKMGVEFRLERLQKNGKEKGSLDIFIEEYGKGSLPYLSKSGGEKVKSSLSVILALAEIKSSSAGIQLGMLFIDEPPFLDDNGVQAYCDALETIQKRYPDIKIMAITHDPAMKARFPQNLDVIKTENGSKVVY